MRRACTVFSLVLAMLAVGGCGTSGERDHEKKETILLFAAASLTDVLEAMVDSFETTEPDAPRVQMNLAGSSLLARQIEHGAGADMFVSAHPSWTTYLYEGGYMEEAVPLPMTNRLVLVSRLEGLRIVDAERLALADPDHVPAGLYARSALECESMWNELEQRIAATVDVRAAVAAVEEGAADAAVVYRSDAVFAPDLHVSDPFTSACQPEITYTISLAPSAGRGARLFAAFVSDTLRAPMWASYGFASRSARADSIPR